MQQLTAREFQERLARGELTVLDVREDWELQEARLPDCVHIPMAQVPARLKELDPARPVVVICHHGMRSLQVAQFLEKKGFADVANLVGGIDAWSEQIDASIPRY